MSQRTYTEAEFWSERSRANELSAIVSRARDLLIAKRPDLMGMTLSVAIRALIAENKQYAAQILELEKKYIDPNHTGQSYSYPGENTTRSKYVGPY